MIAEYAHDIRGNESEHSQHRKNAVVASEVECTREKNLDAGYHYSISDAADQNLLQLDGVGDCYWVGYCVGECEEYS